jgi:hypothetical protein
VTSTSGTVLIERLVIQLRLYFLFDNCISLCLPQVLFSQLLKDNIEVGAEFINCCCYLFIQIHTPIDLYRERLDNYLDSVGVSLSFGIRAGPLFKGVGMIRTSSTITRWQRRNKKKPSGLVVVGRRPCEPLNNPTLLSLVGGSHLKRESHPSHIGLVF